MTAPTFNQIENILWKEIASLYHIAKVPIGGVLLNTELKFNEEWFAIGISTNDVNSFQGFHSPYLLVIIEEALGVAPEIWEAIESLHPYRILAIGNPLEPTGNFFDCFSNPNWYKITVSCLECVEWQEKNGRIPGLVDRVWIDERRAEWGEKSPLYQARVLGEFPQIGEHALIQRSWVDKARKLDTTEEEDEIRIVAADVATKHGPCSNVIVSRVGHTIEKIEMFQGLPAPMTAQKIQHQYERFNGDSIVIDSDGFGEGIADIITNKNIGVLEFHGGRNQKAMDNMRFKNLRSQFYWIVSKKFEKGLYSLKNIPDKEFEILKSQLCSIEMKEPDPLGRIQIETKEDMMARGIASPDCADAFVYAEFGYFMGKVGDIKPYIYH